MSAAEGLGTPTAEQCAEVMVNLAEHADACRRWVASGDKLDELGAADMLREDIAEARELAERLTDNAPELASEWADRLCAAAQRGEDVLAGKPAEPTRIGPRQIFKDGNENDITALDFLRLRLRLPIVGVSKYGTDIDAEHDLHLENGETIRLGVARDVLDQARARAAIFARTGQVVPRVKAADWDDVAVAIGATARVIDTGATQDSETRTWIAKFLGSNGHAATVDTNDRDALLTVLDDQWAARAFRSEDGRVYVHTPSLLERLVRVDRVRITSNELAARLTRLGFEKRRLAVRTYAGALVRRQLWSSPADFELSDDDRSTEGTT